MRNLLRIFTILVLIALVFSVKLILFSEGIMKEKYIVEVPIILGGIFMLLVSISFKEFYEMCFSSRDTSSLAKFLCIVVVIGAGISLLIRF